MANIWIIIATRIAISLAAGEICIRYFSWWVWLRRANERLAVEPLVLGLAICGFSVCSTEIQYMIYSVIARTC